MANIYSDTLQKSLGVTAAGLADNTHDRITKPYQAGGVCRLAHGVGTVNNAAINDVVLLAWVPKGAVLKGGRVATSALGANVQIMLGTLTAGATAADTDDDRFLAATAAATAVQLGVPSAALDAANLPYTIQDPKGAYITATIKNANTAATAQTIKAYIEYVVD